MNPQTADYWIQYLNLQPHPEGGYYKEVFRSDVGVNRVSSTEIKSACTSIYYLLEGRDFSRFHRIASDELWYFHKGSPLHIHVIDPKGTYQVHELSDTDTGVLSLAITPGLWFASEIPSGQGFTLVSCAVAPGFEFAEFEMAKRDEMRSLYPQHLGLIDRLCR